MSLIFENTNISSSGRKKFTLSVTEFGDGTYEVVQRTYRVLSGGDEIQQFEKKSTFRSTAELIEGEYTKTRQGKMFIEAFASQLDREG